MPSRGGRPSRRRRSTAVTIRPRRLRLPETRGLLTGMRAAGGRPGTAVASVRGGAAIDAIARGCRIVRIEQIIDAAIHFDPLGDGEANEAIPNDNLMYRPMQQNPVSIQDANLLKIRVQYCMRLIVPIVDRLLSSTSQFVDRKNTGRASASFQDVSRRTSTNYADVCRSRAGFIVTSEATVRMQSAAVDDEDQCTGGGRMICP